MNSTAYGQPSTGTDSVTITREQQRQCVKWYNTVVAYQDTIIPVKDSIIATKDAFIEKQESTIEKQTEKIAVAKRKQRNTGIIAGSGGVLITSLLFLLLR